jgi:hypothetical protein
MALTSTRRSFAYLAGYLLAGGLGFLLAPELFLTIFLSNGDYDLVWVRFVGALLLALAVLIIGMARHRLEQLYPFTLAARAVILTALVAFFFATADPLFLVLTAVVGLGVVFTSVSMVRDRRSRRPL